MFAGTLYTEYKEVRCSEDHQCLNLGCPAALPSKRIELVTHMMKFMRESRLQIGMTHLSQQGSNVRIQRPLALISI